MRVTGLPRIAGLALVFVFAGGCDFVVRASVDTAGGDPDSGSFDSSISGDGRYVAFWSDADDLVPGDTVDPGAAPGARTLVVWSDGTGPGPDAVTDAICAGCLNVT